MTPEGTSLDRHSAPFEILTPGTHLWRAGWPVRIDAELVVHAQGRFRAARVVKVGPKRTTVAYGTSGTPYREKSVPHAELHVLDHADENAVIGATPDNYAVVRQARNLRTGGNTGGQYLEE